MVMVLGESSEQSDKQAAGNQKLTEHKEADSAPQACEI